MTAPVKSAGPAARERRSAVKASYARSTERVASAKAMEAAERMAPSKSSKVTAAASAEVTAAASTSAREAFRRG